MSISNFETGDECFAEPPTISPEQYEIQQMLKRVQHKSNEMKKAT